MADASVAPDQKVDELIGNMADASVATQDEVDEVFEVTHWPPFTSDPAWQGLTLEPLEDLIYHHDPAHPERHQKNLIWRSDSLDGRYPPNYKEYKELRAKQGAPASETGFPAEKRRELCWACGWTDRNQNHAGYVPRVKLHHARNNMGLWDLAGQWVLRDEPNGSNKSYDFMTQKWLREQGLDINPGGDIPLVPAQIALSTPKDKVNLTLMSQANGYPMDYLWPRISPAQRLEYTRQMADIIKTLRRFTRPSAQKIDGTPLDDFLIGHCKTRRAPSCTKIGPTAEAWLDNLEPSLRGGLSHKYETNDPAIIDANLAELRATFPTGGPYVLTHGDLNFSNVIAKDDKIVAILDWEMAGFYPWWAERECSRFYISFTQELFQGVWKLLEPELTAEKFCADISVPVDAVTKIYRRCNVKHPGDHAAWLMPAFSECEPITGEISWADLGHEIEHQVCDEQWGAKDPHYPYGRDNWYNMG